MTREERIRTRLKSLPPTPWSNWGGSIKDANGEQFLNTMGTRGDAHDESDNRDSLINLITGSFPLLLETLANPPRTPPGKRDALNLIENTKILLFQMPKRPWANDLGDIVDIDGRAIFNVMTMYRNTDWSKAYEFCDAIVTLVNTDLDWLFDQIHARIGWNKLANIQPKTLEEALEVIQEQQKKIETLRRRDGEAAEHVETLICRRTHFTGEEPYVGWKGLGQALRETLDDADDMRASIQAFLGVFRPRDSTAEFDQSNLSYSTKEKIRAAFATAVTTYNKVSSR